MGEIDERLGQLNDRITKAENLWEGLRVTGPGWSGDPSLGIMFNAEGATRPTAFKTRFKTFSFSYDVSSNYYTTGGVLTGSCSETKHQEYAWKSIADNIATPKPGEISWNTIAPVDPNVPPQFQFISGNWGIVPGPPSTDPAILYTNNGFQTEYFPGIIPPFGGGGDNFVNSIFFSDDDPSGGATITGIHFVNWLSQNVTCGLLNFVFHYGHIYDYFTLFLANTPGIRVAQPLTAYFLPSRTPDQPDGGAGQAGIFFSGSTMFQNIKLSIQF